MSNIRQALAKSADGIYRPLDRQIEDCLRPVEAKRDEWFWLRTSGYFAATIAIGAGVLVGMLIVCGFAAVFYCINKVFFKKPEI